MSHVPCDMSPQCAETFWAWWLKGKAPGPTPALAPWGRGCFHVTFTCMSLRPEAFLPLGLCFLLYFGLFIFQPTCIRFLFDGCTRLLNLVFWAHVPLTSGRKRERRRTRGLGLDWAYPQTDMRKRLENGAYCEFCSRAFDLEHFIGIMQR